MPVKTAPRRQTALCPTPRVIPESKRCVRCGVTKAAAEFPVNNRMRSGLYSYCRVCNTEKAAEWRAKNPERVAEIAAARRPRTTAERWEHGLWVKYRMTPDDYWAIHRAQGGVCRICRQPEPSKRGLLHVDHDHATGAVRSLLCQNCNLGLGHFRDNPQLLAEAIGYLAAATKEESSCP